VVPERIVIDIDFSDREKPIVFEVRTRHNGDPWRKYLTDIQVAQIGVALLRILDVRCSDLLRPADVRSGFVYVAGVGPLYKIGRTWSSPARRLRDLSRNAHKPMTLVHSFPCDDPTRAEKALHAGLRSHALGHEMFALPPDVLSMVRSISEFRDGQLYTDVAVGIAK